MSDLSPELNLALCIDNDDTADYLVTTQGLHGSLLVLDGLFSSTTGHTHQGAHQGGSFQDLTIGGNLAVSGALTVTGLSTLASLDVTTTARFRGAPTFDVPVQPGGTLVVGQDLSVTRNASVTGTLSVTGAVSGTSLTMSGAISAAQSISAGAPISGAAGDLNANRGANQGYAFLGNVSHYVGFDGANYQMPTSALYVNGARVVTETEAETLSNKTLATPAVAGVATWNTPQNLPQLSKEANQVIAALAANTTDWIVDYGQTGLVSVPNGGLANQAVSFNRAFAAPPFVLVSLGFFSGAAVSLAQTGVAGHNVTASGLQVDFGNGSGGGQTMAAGWIAIGR